MPFELTNASATFQWLMKTYPGVYLDDMVIFLKDPASHLLRLEAMFEKLEQGRLKLKPSKCEIFHKQITYLGHIISSQGIVTDKEKINFIKMWPTPTTIMVVWSFLGFTGYYWWFIPEFMQIAKPLYELTSAKMQERRGLPSPGTTGANSPLTN